jgi:hypothetical protein
VFYQEEVPIGDVIPCPLRGPSAGMMFKSSARNSNALMTQKRSQISKGKIFNDIELENIREITKL